MVMPPNTDIENARILAERMRKTVDETSKVNKKPDRNHFPARLHFNPSV